MPIRVDNQGSVETPSSTESALLMEVGDYLLLETGDYILIDGSGNYVLADQSTPQSLTGEFQFPQARIGSADNNTTFDATGHQTMKGEGKPWRDELGDLLLVRQQGTGVSVNSSESTVEFTTAADTSDYLYLNIQLNHDKELSAGIYPHIHFFQSSVEVPNFLLQYRWHKNGGSYVASWSNLVCTSLAFPYVTGTMHQIAYSSAITAPSGAQVSDIVQFRILRDNSNQSAIFAGTDSYPGAVGLLSFDAHFQINSLGSTDQYTK